MRRRRKRRRGEEQERGRGGGGSKPENRCREQRKKKQVRAMQCFSTVSNMLTFKNGSPGIVQVCVEQVGIAGWNDGVVRTPTVHRTLPMAELVEILTDVPLVWVRLEWYVSIYQSRCSYTVPEC